jgi:TnpA family transposase
MPLLDPIYIHDWLPYRSGLDEIPSDISNQELLFYFSLDKKMQAFINDNCRLSSSRIALGIQLGAYRFIGRAQPHPEKTLLAVILFVARELNLQGDFVPLKYSERPMTRWSHEQMARDLLGLSLLSPKQHPLVINYLIQLSPDPGHLPDWSKNAEDFLRKKKFVLPGLKVVRRIVLSARHQGLEATTNLIVSRLGKKRIEKLEELLYGDEKNRSKWFELTNKSIYRATPAKVSEILHRIKEVRELSLKNMDFSSIPDQYIHYLSQQGLRLSSKQLKSYSSSRRYAIMAITFKELESEFIDIAVQMNDEILSGVFIRGKERSTKYLKKHRQTVSQVISAFRFMSDALLDETMTNLEKLEYIEEKYPPHELRKLREDSDLLHIPRGTEDLYFASQGYQTIHKYMPQLLETIEITSSSQKDTLLEAAQYYKKRRKEGKTGIGTDAPTDFIQESRWKRIVLDDSGKPKTKPWILCLADKLRKAFRQGSLEIEGARQYRSLNSDLIPWEEWKGIEIKEDNNLPFTASAEKAITPLFRAIQDVSSQYKQWTDEKINSATIDDNNRLHMTKLDKIEEPENVKELRNLIRNKMPKRFLSDILVEADSLTGYSSYLTRLSTGQPIRGDEKTLGQALYALLLASTCNIPFSKIAYSPGLSFELLESIRENVIRPQTLQAAIAVIVDFYIKLPLAQIWGSGTSSSSDGQGFIAEGNPLGAVYNRKRFRSKQRGFIIYTHILDNYAPFYTQVIPASVREATYVLDGLLYHGSSLMSREHYTDSHGYTDIVFAIMYLLGFRLAPRIANIPKLTLWYGKDYEVACPELFSGKISLSSISSQWEAIQRLVGTIYLGKTRASQIIRKLSTFSRKHHLFKALRHLGRLVRTRHILEMAGDKEYRRRILQGLNKGESRNSLAKDIRYGKRGAIRERDPEMQLCVASSMNLSILCIALCNTIYMQRAIRELRQEGYKVNMEDLNFFSPFIHDHINFYGQFNFQPIPELLITSIEKELEPL